MNRSTHKCSTGHASRSRRQHPLLPRPRPWVAPERARLSALEGMRQGLESAIKQLDFNRPDMMDWLPRSDSYAERLQAQSTGKTGCLGWW